jgi:hypothetical protein
MNVRREHAHHDVVGFGDFVVGRGIECLAKTSIAFSAGESAFSTATAFFCRMASVASRATRSFQKLGRQVVLRGRRLPPLGRDLVEGGLGRGDGVFSLVTVFDRIESIVSVLHDDECRFDNPRRCVNPIRARELPSSGPCRQVPMDRAIGCSIRMPRQALETAAGAFWVGGQQS